MFRTNQPSCGFLVWRNPYLSLSSFMMARISWLIGPMMNWQKARCKGSVQPSGCCTLVQTCRKKKVNHASLNKGYRFLTWDWNLCTSPNFFCHLPPKKIPQRHVQNLNQLTSFHPPSSWHWRKSHPTCVASSSPSPHPSSEHRSWQIAPQSGQYVDKNKLKRPFFLRCYNIISRLHLIFTNQFLLPLPIFKGRSSTFLSEAKHQWWSPIHANHFRRQRCPFRVALAHHPSRHRCRWQ